MVALLEQDNNNAPLYILVLNGETGKQEKKILLANQSDKKSLSLKELRVLSSKRCIAVGYSGDCYLIDIENSVSEKITSKHTHKQSQNKYRLFGASPMNGLTIYSLPDRNKLSIMHSKPHNASGLVSEVQINFFSEGLKTFSNENEFQGVLCKM